MIGLSADERARRGHPLWAEVDLGAIRHNVAVLANLAAGAEFMGVVKSYAYGHGNPAAATAMLQGGAARLGVARLAEGLHLREAGIAAPIHLFTEPPPESIPALLEHDIVPAEVFGIQRVWLDRDGTGEDPSRATVHVRTAAEAVTTGESFMAGIAAFTTLCVALLPGRISSAAPAPLPTPQPVPR